MKIGDSTAPTGGGTSLYDTEGTIRRFKPILTSVKITNNGGGDYTDIVKLQSDLPESSGAHYYYQHSQN